MYFLYQKGFGSGSMGKLKKEESSFYKISSFCVNATKFFTRENKVCCYLCLDFNYLSEKSTFLRSVHLIVCRFVCN